MKKAVVLLSLICILIISGCSRSLENIIENEPSITGVVTEVKDHGIMLRTEKCEEDFEADYSISLRKVENEDSYTDIKVGDEVVVYYDGEVLETMPAEIRTVYAVTLKTPVNKN